MLIKCPMKTKTNKRNGQEMKRKQTYMIKYLENSDNSKNYYVEIETIDNGHLIRIDCDDFIHAVKLRNILETLVEDRYIEVS